jgi:hypothetical protein
MSIKAENLSLDRPELFVIPAWFRQQATLPSVAVPFREV